MRRPTLPIAFAAAAVLVACETDRDRATPAPALVVHQATIPLYGYQAARLLREQLAELRSLAHDGSLRARIETTNTAEADAARTHLVQDGVDPAAIVTRSGPDDVVVLTGVTATPADCGATLQPDWFGDVSTGITRLGRCIQADNLAGMADDPADLVAPTRREPADGAVAARSVLDWQRGGPKPSPPQQSGAGQGGGGSGDAPAGGGAVATAGSMDAGAPQPASAPLVNPLLSPAP